MTAADFSEKSKIIIARLRELPEVGEARLVMAFAPLPAERSP